MKLRQLEYFVAIAEELHFGRAAQRLHIVQPALSKQILALERELGIELLDRAHGITLTPAGEVLYDDARLILQRVRGAVLRTQATARGELGSLTVGFIAPAMWSVLPSVLREHRRDNPGVRFHLHESGSPELMQDVREGAVDVAFVRPQVLDDVLVFETVWHEQYMLALSDEHRLADRDVIDLADLRDDSFVTLPRDKSPAIHDLLISMCLSYGFSPKTLEQGNSPAALQMVAMGLGVALISESVQDSGLKGMVFKRLTRPTPEIDLAACYLREPSPELRAFLATMRRVVPHVRAHGRPAAEE